MPFGMMRHGFTYQAPQTSTGPGLWTQTSSIGYNYQQYQNQKLDYVGDDSSSRPIFLYGHISNADSKPYAVLIRRNSDGTYSFSTSVLIWNDANVGTTQATSGLNSSGALVGVSQFAVGSGTYARAYTIDKDALSIGTPGTLATIEGAGNTASFSYNTYLGNNRWGLGGRLSGPKQKLSTVSGTTITAGNNVTLPFGDGIYQQTAGFAYQADNYYRFVGCNGNDGAVGAGHFYNSTAGGTVGIDISTVGQAQRDIARLNSTNSAVMITNSGTTIELDNSLVCVYRDTGGSWNRSIITGSGISLSQSSPVAITDPTSYYATPWGKYVSTGQGNLLMLIMDAGTGTTDSVIYSEVIA